VCAPALVLVLAVVVLSVLLLLRMLLRFALLRYALPLEAEGTRCFLKKDELLFQSRQDQRPDLQVDSAWLSQYRSVSTARVYASQGVAWMTGAGSLAFLALVSNCTRGGDSPSFSQSLTQR
jgi:hypothetical protein